MDTVHIKKERHVQLKNFNNRTDIIPPRTDVLKNKPVYRVVKRIMDFSLSIAALIVLFPFLILVAVVIYIDDPGASPIFVQKRVGKNGTTFKIYKFRSMVANAEQLLDGLKAKGGNIKPANDPTFKQKDDPRITRVGRFIRKTSIDELPQLFNIIKGDMSIVGPRPALPCEVETYNDFSRQRLLMRPGLTCYWQSTMNRDDIPFDKWMKMDVNYIKHCGVLEDIKIIIATVRVVLSGNGN